MSEHATSRQNLTHAGVVQKADGSRFGPVPTQVVDAQMLTVFGNVVTISPGDAVIIELSEGRQALYRVSAAVFRAGLLDIPDSWSLKVLEPRDVATNTNVRSTELIENAHVVPVGNQTLQAVYASFDSLLLEIERSDATQFQKEEARSQFFRTLKHPSVKATLGKKAFAIGKMLITDIAIESDTDV